MDLIDAPSQHFNDRADGQRPSLIVLHFTHEPFEQSLETLTKGRPGHKVSSHYLIREDGQLYRLVNEDKRAWHAGVSYWNGITDVNSASIGIEIVNDGITPYPSAQIAAVKALCKDLQQRYDIPAHNIVGHADIAPDRKVDPGAHFPWEKLAHAGIGVMPKVKMRDRLYARLMPRSPRRLQKLFARAGYKAANINKLVAAFQQRYEPEAAQPGRPTAATIAQLHAVARYNKKHKGYAS